MNEENLAKLTEHVERKNGGDYLQDDINDLNNFVNTWCAGESENKRQEMYADLINLAINIA